MLEVATRAGRPRASSALPGRLRPVRAQPQRRSTTTIDRLWLFLAAGVLVGTVLAASPGSSSRGRAMRPIASLTAAAREIAATRDPSRRMPQPDTDDEVAELAATLDQMLRALDAARTETRAGDAGASASSSPTPRTSCAPR